MVGLLLGSAAWAQQGRGWPDKPADLDHAGWATLQKAVVQQARLIGDASSAGADGAALDQLGISVALSGDTALVGAHRDDIGANSDQGSAYVFTRDGGNWALQAKLIALDGAAGDLFGSAVALSGDTALVGAPRHDIFSNDEQGAAYVFSRSGSIWNQQVKLRAFDGASGDEFGISVAVSGDTALVGAFRDNLQRGAAYVFERNGDNWPVRDKLTAGDGSVGDQFGISVALSGDTALVGAHQDNSDRGSAYVYKRSGETWTEQAKLSAGDGAAGDAFGWSVALSGDSALVGAHQDDVGTDVDQGSAYIFSRTGSTWTEQAQLLAADGASGDQFGYAVALFGDTALVGAHQFDIGANNNQGSAYLFARSDTSWSQQSKLSADDGAFGDMFGVSVALSSDTALVGAVDEDGIIHVDQGSAYVFTGSGSAWSQQTQLTTGQGAGSDEFGYAVALSGGTALVGAYRDDIGGNADQGSVHVFTRSGDTWTLQAMLTAGDGEPGDRFGFSVAMSDNTALVGAVGDDIGANDQQGSVYVFARSGGIWNQQAKLIALDGAVGDLFGSAVALDGDTALVGAKEDDIGANNNQGSAYVFARSGSNWSEQAKLTADDGAASDQFGYAVALSGDTALVGALFADVDIVFLDQGSAYVFTRGGDTWTQQAKLTAVDGEASDRFGNAVALSGDTALVGAYFDDISSVNDNQGSAYVFVRGGSAWSLQAKLTALDNRPIGRFGSSVALTGNTALVGSPRDDVSGTEQGSAYVFIRDGGTWTQEARLFAADRTDLDWFGSSAALSSGSALVGAPNDDGMPPFGNPNEGAAYVFAGVGPEDTSTVITSDLPDPSMIGVAVSIQVSVAGASSQPSDGQITVSATTGESCTDTTPTAGPGNSALFDCDLVFAIVGPRTLTASFSGSAAHADSSSPAEPHAVVTILTINPDLLANGTFGAPYSAMLSASGTGSSEPYGFVVTGGTLPPGLTLATNGTLTGTPSAAGGPFDFTVTANDSSSAAVGGPFTGARDYSISIAKADQAALFATATPSTIPFDGTSSLSSSGGSGTGSVSYAVTAGGSFCTAVGNMLTGIGVGTCTVVATKAADANYNAATAAVDVEVLPAADLEISKNDGSPYAIPGSFVEYEILVGNVGPLPVVGARVEDPVPDGLTGALWICAPVQGASCPNASGSGGIDELVDLPVNGVLRYVFSATVDAPLGATVTNTAMVAVPDGTVETDASDNNSSDVNTVVSDSLLADGFENSTPRLSIPME